LVSLFNIRECKLVQLLSTFITDVIIDGIDHLDNLVLLLEAMCTEVDLSLNHFSNDTAIKLFAILSDQFFGGILLDRVVIPHLSATILFLLNNIITERNTIFANEYLASVIQGHAIFLLATEITFKHDTAPFKNYAV
jgi:hypothetical protein